VIKLVISKTRQFFPSDEKSTRFPASLSFPSGQGTMPASAFKRFSPPHNLITQQRTTKLLLSQF
jgi:hypothetical protein